MNYEKQLKNQLEKSHSQMIQNNKMESITHQQYEMATNNMHIKLPYLIDSREDLTEK